MYERQGTERKFKKKEKKKKTDSVNHVNANQIGCLCCRLASVLQPTHLTKKKEAGDAGTAHGYGAALGAAHDGAAQCQEGASTL